MALSLENLLEQGFTRDDIMRLADEGAFRTPVEPEEVESTPEPAPAAPVTSGDNAALAILSQVLENQNKMILSMMEAKKSEPDPAPEPTPEDEARKFSDEKLVSALQSLNILKNGDNIDIGKTVEQNIQDKVLTKLGTMVGFTVEKGK